MNLNRLLYALSVGGLLLCIGQAKQPATEIAPVDAGSATG